MFKTKIKMCTDTNLCKENGCYAITLFYASSLPLRREVFFFFSFLVKNWWVREIMSQSMMFEATNMEHQSHRLLSHVSLPCSVSLTMKLDTAQTKRKLYELEVLQLVFFKKKKTNCFEYRFFTIYNKKNVPM
jgi:hypothetical protein